MSERSAGRRMAPLFALTLALWAAYPAIQWCPAGWGHFKLECFVGPMRFAERCGSDCAHCSQCPLAPPAGRDRAYCLSDPNGGPGLRPMPPRLLGPTLSPVAILVALADLAPPTAIRRSLPRETARPPTSVWTALPPVRGP